MEVTNERAGVPNRMIEVVGELIRDHNVLR